MAVLAAVIKRAFLNYHRRSRGHYDPEVVDRLDEERIEALRAWGTRLATDGREELRAAGKAIMILIDEIERLQVDARHMPDVRKPLFLEASNGEEAQQEPVEPVSSQSLGTSLRERLGAAIPSRSTYGREE